MKNPLKLIQLSFSKKKTTNLLNTLPPTHDLWSTLLQKHVNEEGLVYYLGFEEDRKVLKSYLKQLSNHPPTINWSKNQTLAYWINAYNAFTIELILQHYPLKSIRDIQKKYPMLKSSWKVKFFEIGHKKMHLDAIEHDILRKEFDEPRIHFAIVCASISCPKLLNEAYTPENLEEQLERQAIDFANRPSKNRITSKHAQLSQIFNWYSDDFTSKMSLNAYINQYSAEKINENTSIEYLEYDWNLNKQ